MELTKKIILPDLFYDMCNELRSQSSEFESFSRDGFVEIEKICSEYLKFGGYTYMFCSATQILFSLKTFIVSTESVTL